MSQRFYIIEKTMFFIRQKETGNIMGKAADTLLFDYQADKELTSFTNIDYDEFYKKWVKKSNILTNN